MTSSQSKSKRPGPQPAPERGFAGKSPLVSGMLAKRDQLIASATLLKTVSQAQALDRAKEGYKSKLLALAKDISAARRSEKISRMIDEAIRENAQEPKNEKEALETAFARIGIRAQILSKKEATYYSFFTISLDGRERKVPFPNTIMEKNPVDEFIQILGTLGIVGSSQDLMKFRREEFGSYRPPPEPIDVEPELLEKRKISYDGKIGGRLMQFTYYAEGINTSFGISGDLRNGELLAQIDSRILEMHEKFGIPLDPEVVEQQASDRAVLRYGRDEEVGRILNAIHFLAEGAFERNLVPTEYLEALDALRSSPEYYAFKTAVPLTGEELGQFKEAYEQLDSPAHAMARAIGQIYTSEGGKLTKEGEHIVRQALEQGEKSPANIEGAALANIAIAFSILSGDDEAACWSQEKIKKNHLGMMFQIRSKMKEITGNRVFSD